MPGRTDNPAPPPNRCRSGLMATQTHEARLAVLIDADNASAQHLERLLVEIAKCGTATVPRASVVRRKPARARK